MNILFLGDFWIGLEPVTELLHELNNKIDTDKIFSKNYGTSVSKLVPLLFFRPGDFKQRKRFDKNKKTLFIDVLFDYNNINHLVKEKDIQQVRYIIGENLLTLIPVIKKYHFDDFNLDEFELDLKTFLEVNNFLVRFRKNQLD